MHAASGKPTRVQERRLSRWWLRAGIGSAVTCGPIHASGPANRFVRAGSCATGPAEGGCASSRSIFASCSVRRVSCSSARLICSCACASRSSAPGRARGVQFLSAQAWSSLAFSFSVQCHPKVAGRPAARTPVLSKEWPYHGESAVRRKNAGSHGAESGAAAQPKRRCRCPVPFVEGRARKEVT